MSYTTMFPPNNTAVALHPVSTARATLRVENRGPATAWVNATPSSAKPTLPTSVASIPEHQDFALASGETLQVNVPGGEQYWGIVAVSPNYQMQTRLDVFWG